MDRRVKPGDDSGNQSTGFHIAKFKMIAKSACGGKAWPHRGYSL
jgi:hypothetical protein